MPFFFLFMQKTSQRIHSIDAVRALALFGILMAHAHNRFNFFVAEHATCGADAVYDWLYQNIFVCKAFMVFAFLFGLSFFLQMDHADAKGIDFRGRFCWRLVLLFLFGVFHSFFYQGDILTIFAVLGFIPVLLWKLTNRTVTILCAICLSQPLVLGLELFGQSDLLQQAGDAIRGSFGICWLDPAKQNSLWETGLWNVTHGIGLSWVYLISSGRLLILIGMFLLGMLAGRFRIFEQKSHRLLRLAAVGACVYLCSFAGQLVLPVWMHWWEDTGFVLMVVPFAAWLLARPVLAPRIGPLSAIGRCTLTCYITQNIIMAVVLCGYGFGMNPHLSTTGIMNWSVVLYIAQVLFSMLWLKYHRYGPFEAIWRRLTRIGLKS